MKITVKYSGKIINLPSGVAEFAPDATREELAVIIAIFADIEVLSDFDKYISAFSERLGIGIERIQRALKFWADKGVIDIEGMDESQIISSSASMPTYTGAQIAKFVEKNEDIRSLFISCQAILGKEFNTSDHNHIIFLRDFYKLGNEYILLLLAHCKELGKANWSYVKKTAQNLYDEGIDTYGALEAHFADRRNKSTLEYKIRELFGIGKRELSKSEREKIEKWISLELDIDFIRLAYDITIDRTSKPSLAYCAKIVENWLCNGIRSAKDAKRLEDEKSSGAGASSFDTNDFFEAALQRSYKKGER